MDRGKPRRRRNIRDGAHVNCGPNHSWFKVTDAGGLERDIEVCGEGGLEELSRMAALYGWKLQHVGLWSTRRQNQA